MQCQARIFLYRNIKYGFRLSVGCLAFPLSGLSGGDCAAQGVYLMMDELVYQPVGNGC